MALPQPVRDSREKTGFLRGKTERAYNSPAIMQQTRHENFMK